MKTIEIYDHFQYVVFYRLIEILECSLLETGFILNETTNALEQLTQEVKKLTVMCENFSSLPLEKQEEEHSVFLLWW